MVYGVVWNPLRPSDGRRGSEFATYGVKHLKTWVVNDQVRGASTMTCCRASSHFCLISSTLLFHECRSHGRAHRHPLAMTTSRMCSLPAMSPRCTTWRHQGTPASSRDLHQARWAIICDETSPSSCCPIRNQFINASPSRFLSPSTDWALDSPLPHPGWLHLSAHAQVQRPRPRQPHDHERRNTGAVQIHGVSLPAAELCET